MVIIMLEKLELKLAYIENKKPFNY